MRGHTLHAFGVVGRYHADKVNQFSSQWIVIMLTELKREVRLSCIGDLITFDSIVYMICILVWSMS